MQIKTKLKSILDRDGFLRVRNVLNFNKDLKPILNDMEYVMDNLVHKFAPEHMKEKIFYLWKLCSQQTSDMEI